MGLLAPQHAELSLGMEPSPTLFWGRRWFDIGNKEQLQAAREGFAACDEGG